MLLNLPALPEKKGILGKVWSGIKKAYGFFVRPSIYNTEVLSETQRINTERMIEAQQARDRAQQEIQKAQMILQALQAKANVELQAEQGELNRQLQGQLARLNREVQAEEGNLNRELQLKLTQLNQEFQAEQGNLNREHAEKLEILRGELQKLVLGKQRELQLELKEIDAKLSRELRVYDRQTSLEVIKEQKREKNSPLFFVAEDLVATNPDKIRLLVLFSPHKLKQDQLTETVGSRGFPESEHVLSDYLRDFFQKYNLQDRIIEFLPGAWTSKAFHSESAATAIFRGLKTEPTLILEDLIEGNNLFINIAFWGSNWSKPRYQKALSISWRETLFDFVKIRTLDWAEKYQKDAEKLERIFDSKVIEEMNNNLRILEKEQECLKTELDPREMERPYSEHEKDYDALIQFVATCHCLFAGIFADEFFLLHVPPQERKPPLLPELLPEIIQEIPEEQQQELLEMIVSSYEAMYQVLAEDESAWIPELKLDLAASLSHLPSQLGARKQVEESIQEWLTLHGIDGAGAEPIEALNAALTPDDQAYVAKLNQCLSALGEAQQLDVAMSCYNRGKECYQKGEYQKAIAALTQALQINGQQAEVYYERGLAYSQAKQYPEAIEDFSQALKISPNSAKIYYERGNVYQKLGKPQKALTDYQNAINLKPDFSEANEQLKRVELSCAEKARRDQFLEILRKAKEGKGWVFKD